jgi:hypothetical protein
MNEQELVEELARFSAENAALRKALTELLDAAKREVAAQDAIDGGDVTDAMLAEAEDAGATIVIAMNNASEALEK